MNQYPEIKALLERVAANQASTNEWLESIRHKLAETQESQEFTNRLLIANQERTIKSLNYILWGAVGYFASGIIDKWF